MVAVDYVDNAKQIANKTQTIFVTSDLFENIYNIFDDLLLLTRIL